MAFCRNCGCELPTDSKFCNKCGTNTEITVASSVPVPSSNRNLGAEISVYYYSEKSKFSASFSAWFTGGGLLLLLLLSGVLPIPRIIKIICIIFLIYSIIVQFVNANHIEKEVLRVCEHGIRGVRNAAFFTMADFSIPYDEVTHVGSASTGLLFMQYERIIITTRQGMTYMIDIREPNAAAAEIEKLSGRTLR
ncbi:MAG: zinc ribbon domain-containing protein [Ruminococcus sp.]|nr:zinc ribbon domain-containing protein [Ruminococcus sp.]